METFHYQYKSKSDRKLRQSAAILYEKKYAEYYVRLAYAQKISLSFTLLLVGFILYGFTSEMGILLVFGIFSLVTLSCQQRRKEIAIRKVNGANIGIILNLFFREYLLLLVFSSFFAFPLGYVMMKHWLENYIKQTPIEWWLYAVIFIGMGLVIFLSIIWRVWKAARQNPAEVLKSE